MEEHIKSESSKLDDPNDLNQFRINIHEDLEELGPQSIIGLGITIKQVQDWQKNRDKS